MTLDKFEKSSAKVLDMKKIFKKMLYEVYTYTNTKIHNL